MEQAYKTAQEVLGERAWTLCDQKESEASAWGVTKPSLNIEKLFIKLPQLLDNEVQVSVKFCGMCHSDIHNMTNCWKKSLNGLYPLIPGHEFVGEVTKLGEKAQQKFKIGQMLGFGVFRGACGTCDFCQEDQEQLCMKLELTYGPNAGGYATLFQANMDWFFPLPQNLNVAKAAPLFCAGLTVFSPLKEYLREGTKVGIVGIGGLGHLAIQFAAKLKQNIEVTAISSNETKEQECKQFGANKFIKLSEESIQQNRGYFDFILYCSSVGSLLPYVTMLKNGGTLCVAGAPSIEQDLGVSMFHLLRKKKIVGTLVGTRNECLEMLQICAEKEIYPEIEVVPFSRVNEWIERLEKGIARYRYVIDFSQ